MAYLSISKKIHNTLKFLNHQEQKMVLEYIHSILKKRKKEKNYLSYHGIMDKNEAETIKNFIENGCEKIDHNEW